jgi:hypothetical protein
MIRIEPAQFSVPKLLGPFSRARKTVSLRVALVALVGLSLTNDQPIRAYVVNPLMTRVGSRVVALHSAAVPLQTSPGRPSCGGRTELRYDVTRLRSFEMTLGIGGGEIHNKRYKFPDGQAVDISFETSRSSDDPTGATARLGQVVIAKATVIKRVFAERGRGIFTMTQETQFGSDGAVVYRARSKYSNERGYPLSYPRVEEVALEGCKAYELFPDWEVFNHTIGR